MSCYMSPFQIIRKIAGPLRFPPFTLDGSSFALKKKPHRSTLVHRAGTNNELPASRCTLDLSKQF